MGHLKETTAQPGAEERIGPADPAGFVGVVCGIEAEARCIAAALSDRAAAGAAPIAIRVAISAARPAEADAISRRFIEEGALSLVSFGIAGGLDPSLAAADVVVATEVTDGVGSYSCARRSAWPPDWRRGVIFGCDRMISDPAEKRVLHAAGPIAVDMESHRIGRIASEAGIPLHVVRAISDAADQRLPPYVLSGIGRNGKPRIVPIIAGLARAPTSLSELLALRRSTNAALASLRLAARQVVEILSPARGRDEPA